MRALRQISAYLWEVPGNHRPDMLVPARVYISEEMLAAIAEDKSIEQLVNVATLPGIQGYSLAMPDIHQGYGFPVGGVAAIRTADGVISPGGIGYDINCGVRLLTSPYKHAQLARYMEALATQLQCDIPSGVGRGGFYALKLSELNQVLNDGLKWANKRGFAWDSDIDATEELGSYPGADAECVSERAKKRGADQLGTIGAGNHFVEIQKVAQIFDSDVAQDFGLFENQIVVMVHTGSRGLGHQTCTDYVKLMNQSGSFAAMNLPDRELACAPFKSEEGQAYFKAMAAAANFAWVNRQVITFQIRNAFKQVIREVDSDQLGLLYDVSHNIAKLESYDGVECIVHRKGATRAFGPEREELPLRFRTCGQPVIIPGSMGTASYVLAGRQGYVSETYGSCCHGAGRALSRRKAKKVLDYNRLLGRLEEGGIVVRAGSAAGLLEEAPQAYKNIDDVIEVVAGAQIAKVVARLVPLAVIKG